MEIRMSTASCSIAELSGISHHDDPRKMLEAVIETLNVRTLRDWHFAWLQFSDRCDRVDKLDRTKLFKEFLLKANLADVVFDSGTFTNPNTGNIVRVCLVDVGNRETFTRGALEWLRNNPK